MNALMLPTFIYIAIRPHLFCDLCLWYLCLNEVKVKLMYWKTYIKSRTSLTLNSKFCLVFCVHLVLLSISTTQVIFNYPILSHVKISLYMLWPTPLQGWSKTNLLKMFADVSLGLKWCVIIYLSGYLQIDWDLMQKLEWQTNIKMTDPWANILLFL